MSSPGSDFLLLITQLDEWYENLPEQLQATPINFYAHREMGVLGAVMFLHLGYHGAIADLTRVSLNGFDFPLAEAFQSVPLEFRAECQSRCRYHSDRVSHTIRLGLEHGMMAFDDSYCHFSAFEATKVQVVHSSTPGNSAQDRMAAIECIKINIELMRVKEGLPQGILVR